MFPYLLFLFALVNAIGEIAEVILTQFRSMLCANACLWNRLDEVEVLGIGKTRCAFLPHVSASVTYAG